MKNYLLSLIIFLTCSFNLSSQCDPVCHEIVTYFIPSFAPLMPVHVLNGIEPSCLDQFEIQLESTEGMILQPYAASVGLDCSTSGTFTVRARNKTTNMDCTSTLIVQSIAANLVKDTLEVTLGTDQSVTVWAIDFDNGSYDPCHPTEKLRFTFGDIPPSEDPNFDEPSKSSFRIFDCLDFNSADNNGNLNVAITVWNSIDTPIKAWSVLKISDSEAPCQSFNRAVHVVNNNCNGIELALNGNALSRAGCNHEILSENLQVQSNTLAIINQQPDLSGISTVDFVLMLKGVIEGFSSPRQAILSDLDSDGTVSTYDIIGLRRVILGLDQLSDYDLFKIVPADFDFNSITDIFDLGSDFQSILFDESDIVDDRYEIEVLKGGDVSEGKFAPDSETKSLKKLPLSFRDKYLEKGQQYQIPFVLRNDKNLLGALMKIKIMGQKILSISSKMDENDLLYHIVGDEVGLSYLSFTGSDELTITINIEANESVFLSDIISLDDAFENGAVDKAVDAEYGIELIGNNATVQICAEMEDSNNQTILNIRTRNFTDIAAYQFGVAWDNTNFAFDHIGNLNPNLQNLTDKSFGPETELSNEAMNVIRALWVPNDSRTTTLENGAILFSIYLNNKQEVSNPYIGIVEEEYFPIEFTDASFNTIEVDARGDGCNITAIINPTSTEDDIPWNHQITIYPNPNDGIFQINDDTSKISNVSLINLQGQVLQSWILEANRTGDFNISKYPIGIYLLRITSIDQNQTVYKKIVKM